ncbi:MAG: precorrin-4 C(11)-methyltransferase [Thermodesulfobacteriota bacterium]
MTPNKKSDANSTQVFFVGAGPGDPDLITVKGRDLLSHADLVIYAGSLVNPDTLKHCRADARLIDSAPMELTEITDTMIDAARSGEKVVRLHTGDPTFYGALPEQAEALIKADIDFQVVPGVSSAFASAAALKVGLTMPEITQTIILTRLSGKTPVPEAENLKSLASHGATICIFLSIAMIEEVITELLEGGYLPSTPAAVVYRASWPDEKVIRADLSKLAAKVKEAAITKQAMIIVSKTLTAPGGEDATERPKSKLYDKDFEHEYRQNK